jgi:hypothetical protein
MANKKITSMTPVTAIFRFDAVSGNCSRDKFTLRCRARFERR